MMDKVVAIVVASTQSPMQLFLPH